VSKRVSDIQFARQVEGRVKEQETAEKKKKE
jgi:hypothetical protein